MGKDEVPIRHLPPDQNRARWPTPIANQEPTIDPAVIQDAWLDLQKNPTAIGELLRRLNDEEPPEKGRKRPIWTRRVLQQMLSARNICAMAGCSPSLCSCNKAEPDQDDPENWVEWGLTTHIEPDKMEHPARATEGFEPVFHNARD